MKKLAVLIYPEFSLQEIGDLMFLFRWAYDVKTVMFSTSTQAVRSEEGVCILPEKTIHEFRKKDYYCLVLPGCSDMKEAMQDKELFKFLNSFKEDNEFVIGAICAGPMFLSIAGLLDTKKYTNSMPYELNKHFTPVNMQNIVFAAVVEDQNIITAVGEAFRQFAIRMARKVGFECSDHVMMGIKEKDSEQDYIHHIPIDEMQTFQNEDLAFFETQYTAIKKHLK